MHRCPSCHIALWSHYGGRTYAAFVRAGTLDTAAAVRPDAHIFTRSKLPWLALPADQPAFEVFYELETQWPAESLARRAAARRGSPGAARALGHPGAMTAPTTTTAGEPTADVDITPDLARALLLDQHPDLAGLPIRPAETGWDNEVYRLGDDLALRLPRRRGGGMLILREQHYLPLIAANLPLPAPIPLRIGKPALGYPYSWSVVPWFEGVPTDRAPPDADQGEVLAAFLAALHRPAPDDAPQNPYRGGPLADRAEAFEDRFAIAERAARADRPRTSARPGTPPWRRRSTRRAPGSTATCTAATCW